MESQKERDSSEKQLESRPRTEAAGEYLILFEKAMKKLALAFDKEMPKERFLIYFEHLSKYTIEEIQYAVNRAIREEEYNVIPPVGRLIKYIEEMREENYFPMLEYQKEERMSKEKAREALNKIFSLIDEKGKQNEEKRLIKFEERREQLRKQAKLFLGGE